MDSYVAVSYFVLVTFTFAMIALGWLNYRKFGGVEHIFIVIGLYYYSLFGAWTILALKSGYGTSDALDHLERSLTTVQIDGDYVVALFIYGIFNVVLLFGLWLSERRAWTLLPRPNEGTHILSERRLLAIAFVALALSASALKTEITEALQSGSSIYLFTRAEGGRWFTFHQLLNRLGLAALACAWPMFLLSSQSSKRRRRAFSLLLATVSWIAYLGVLGNRNELVVAVVGGAIFFTACGGRLKASRIAVLGITAFLSLRIIEYLRAVPVEEFSERLITAVLDPLFWNPANAATGSESMAAHVSLYGVIARDVPFTFGSSLLYLAQSLIPFYPGNARVADSYRVYAQALDAPEGQGFNIHFVAGAYLNGALPAVLIATFLLLGALWLAGSGASILFRSQRFRFAGVFPYSMFVALLPFSLRGGPEGLKGLMFEGFGIAALVCFLALTKKQPPESRDADRTLAPPES